MCCMPEKPWWMEFKELHLFSICTVSKGQNTVLNAPRSSPLSGKVIRRNVELSVIGVHHMVIMVFQTTYSA